MRQKPGTRKEPAEKVVNDIRVTAFPRRARAAAPLDQADISFMPQSMVLRGPAHIALPVHHRTDASAVRWKGWFQARRNSPNLLFLAGNALNLNLMAGRTLRFRSRAVTNIRRTGAMRTNHFVKEATSGHTDIYIGSKRIWWLARTARPPYSPTASSSSRVSRASSSTFGAEKRASKR